MPARIFALIGLGTALTYGVLVARLSFGPPLVVLGLGGMVLALCGVALWRILNPLLRSEEVAQVGPQAPARVRELEREKQGVLKAIREIELDYQMKKIAQGDYEEMTSRYRARAMRLIRELDAGEDYRALIEQELKLRLSALAAVGAPPPSCDRTACPACASRNDGDAQFCKKCGAKLEGKA